MDERTNELLVELRDVIDRTLDGAADEGARLAELAGAVERRTRAELELSDRDDSLAEDLHEAAIKLEADHPALAGALRRAVDLLGSVGL